VALVSADDGRPLASDDRELRRQLRAQDRVLQAAYDEGVRGVRQLDEGTWPAELLDQVHDAHAAGVDENSRSRREARRARVRSALCWAGRHAAPRTARRLRRARRKIARVWALTGEVRHR
jgi:hypothetical protein